MPVLLHHLSPMLRLHPQIFAMHLRHVGKLNLELDRAERLVWTTAGIPSRDGVRTV